MYISREINTKKYLKMFKYIQNNVQNLQQNRKIDILNEVKKKSIFKIYLYKCRLMLMAVKICSFASACTIRREIIKNLV